MTTSPLHQELRSIIHTAGYAPDAICSQLNDSPTTGIPDRPLAEHIAIQSVNQIAGGRRLAVCDVLGKACRNNVHPDAIPYLLQQFANELRRAGRHQWARQIGILTGRANAVKSNWDNFYADEARLYAETDCHNPSAEIFRDAITETLGRGIVVHEPGCGKTPKDLRYQIQDSHINAGHGYEICAPAAQQARQYVSERNLTHSIQIHSGRFRDVLAAHPEFFNGQPAATVHCSVTHFATEHELRKDLSAEACIADLICDARKTCGKSPWDNGDLLLRRFGDGGHRKLSVRDNVPRSFVDPEYQAALYGSILAPQEFELVHAEDRNVGIYDSPGQPETLHTQIWARSKGKAWRR